jgi:apolipoprotein D and lipocalin family protein
MLFLLLAMAAAAQTVPQLDTPKYLGRWYQAYSDFAVEATFENSSYCVTADYGMNPNGTVSVTNRERQYGIDGPERIIYGWADATNASEPGQLTVHLETTHFPAPYWVFQLGPDTYNGTFYEYAVVSDPFHLTLFVLARNLTTFAAFWQSAVLTWLAANGFTTFLNKPIQTIQANCTYY